MAEQVMIHNKLNQAVKVVLRDAAGKDVTVTLAPRGRHGPVDKGQLAKRTKNLADRGHIRVRPV